MFDIGWTEMVMIIVVMVIVVGPKDLPRMLHQIGQWIGRVRQVARQFQDGIEQMAHDAGVDDLKKQIDSVSDISFEDEVAKTIDPKGELTDAFSVETGALDEKKTGKKEKKDDPASTATPVKKDET
jgi:sec-independent protein translocase protein TatB